MVPYENGSSTTINITNPCKAWWPGDKRVEKYMISVIDVLEKHKISQPARTEIYNRAYEAVYSAIKDIEIIEEKPEFTGMSCPICCEPIYAYKSSKTFCDCGERSN